MLSSLVFILLNDELKLFANPLLTYESFTTIAVMKINYLELLSQEFVTKKNNLEKLFISPLEHLKSIKNKFKIENWTSKIRP